MLQYDWLWSGHMIIKEMFLYDEYDISRLFIKLGNISPDFIFTPTWNR